MTKAIKATEAPKREGSRYPKPYDEICQNRTKYLLSDVFGLTQYGVNLVVIEPGAWSSQRHSHEKEDEFIYVLEGAIEINYGKEIYKLEKGDSIYLDSIVLHNVHAGNNQSARILAVVYAPF